MIALLMQAAAWIGLPERIRRAAAIAFLVAAGVAIFFGAKALYDHSIISKHDSGQALQQERQDRKADNGAAEQRRADDAREAQERRQLEEAATNGQTDTDRRLAFHRCLRLQQQARDSGKPAPDC